MECHPNSVAAFIVVNFKIMCVALVFFGVKAVWILI